MPHLYTKSFVFMAIVEDVSLQLFWPMFPRTFICIVPILFPAKTHNLHPTAIHHLVTSPTTTWAYCCSRWVHWILGWVLHKKFFGFLAQSNSVLAQPSSLLFHGGFFSLKLLMSFSIFSPYVFSRIVLSSSLDTMANASTIVVDRSLYLRPVSQWTPRCIVTTLPTMEAWIVHLWAFLSLTWIALEAGKTMSCAA
jgi:hypothetical protein